MRGQVYTTAASLKIAGLAAGTALAGPLAGRSVTACLLIAAVTELGAAAAYLLAGMTRPGDGMRGRCGRKPACGCAARDGRRRYRGRHTHPFGIMFFGFCYPGSMQRVTQWWLVL
jgi:hypothetical protein